MSAQLVIIECLPLEHQKDSLSITKKVLVQVPEGFTGKLPAAVLAKPTEESPTWCHRNLLRVSSAGRPVLLASTHDESKLRQAQQNQEESLLPPVSPVPPAVKGEVVKGSSSTIQKQGLERGI